MSCHVIYISARTLDFDDEAETINEILFSSSHFFDKDPATEGGGGGDWLDIKHPTNRTEKAGKRK